METKEIKDWKGIACMWRRTAKMLAVSNIVLALCVAALALNNLLRYP